MSSGSHRLILVLVLESVNDLLLRQAQGVKVFVAAKLLAGQQCLSQRRCVSQTLQN